MAKQPEIAYIEVMGKSGNWLLMPPNRSFTMKHDGILVLNFTGNPFSLTLGKAPVGLFPIQRSHSNYRKTRYRARN